MFLPNTVTKYSSVSLGIMLIASVLPLQTFTIAQEALDVNTSTQNDDGVATQSPGPGHYRAGHINWRPTGSTNQVEFNVLNAFTRDEYPICINAITLTPTPCTGPGGFPGVGDVFRETIANGHTQTGTGAAGTELFFGDGTNSGALLYRVDAIDVPENMIFAHAIDPSQSGEKIRHTYPSAGIFTAEIDDFARNVIEENNNGGGYRVSTRVNLSLVDSSPVSTLPLIVVCPEALCTFQIPASDSNGDTLNFRLSTSSEASDPLIGPFVQPGQGTSQPLTVSSSGMVTWDASGFASLPECAIFIDPFCIYSTSITIEEIRSGSMIGKVTVDFLINIAAPSFDVPPTPPNGFTFNIIVGVTLPVILQCSDPNDGDQVTIVSLGLPPDGTLTPSVPGNPATRIFSFSPSAVQTVNVTFRCSDGENSVDHTIKIKVTPAPPRVVKTVHAEKSSFEVVPDGVPLIKDITIVAEIYEDLNTQLVMKKQVQVITCLKIAESGKVLSCSVAVPPADIVPVSGCSEVPVETQPLMNTIVKGGSSSQSDGMNTVIRNFLVKTVDMQKEVFTCDFGTPETTDDVRVDQVLFTEIFENLAKLDQTPPQNTLIKTTFESFRCVMDLDTFEVQACEFPTIF